VAMINAFPQMSTVKFCGCPENSANPRNSRGQRTSSGRSSCERSLAIRCDSARRRPSGEKEAATSAAKKLAIKCHSCTSDEMKNYASHSVYEELTLPRRRLY